ncbi:MAG: NADH-quinone oxidoreductase subunit, partial [Actinomycetota bacterium]
VKRMLAYSSISHAGFMLVGMEAAGHTAGTPFGSGVSTVAMYLPLYSILTVGSFAVVALVARQEGGDTSIDAFSGLARRRPVLAAAFTVFLLAQAGVPFTSGFVAKWGVVQAAVEQQSYVLAVIAMVAAVVAAFMYLRIMVSVWLTDPSPDAESVRIPFGAGIAITMSVLVTLAVGVWPDWMLDAAESVVAVAR